MCLIVRAVLSVNEVFAGVVSRVMFRRVTKQKPADEEVLLKTYVSSVKMFEFGPLPAGQEAELCVAPCCATFALVAAVTQYQHKITT